MAGSRRSLPTWAVIVLMSLVLLFEYYEKRQPATPSEPLSNAPVRLDHVIDGDTVDVRSAEGERLRVRLLGIDCMETYQEDKMKRQADRLQRSLRDIESLGRDGKKLLANRLRRAELRMIQPEGVPGKDPYGRTLAYLEADEEDVAITLLEAGLAETRREPHPRSERYQSAARRGKRSGSGIYAK